MARLNIIMVPEKVTKNTVRFEEKGSNDVGYIYIPKTTLARVFGSTPKAIEVTVEEVKPS